MKISQFIVEQPGCSPDSVLLYSTFSTSMVELENSLYHEIFEQNDFLLHPKEVKALSEMGFLVEDDIDELLSLESLRKKTIASNKVSPTYYIICPTTGCNARCHYCFEKGAVQKRMDSRTSKAVAEYIVKNHDDKQLMIQWFGGEPLLEPEIISYITDYLHENGVKFDSKIITNGYLLNKKVISLAVNKWNVQIIQITIDALGEEYNRIKNYIYPKGDPFKIVMDNIQCCLNAGINVRIRINFNPEKYSGTIETVEYLKEHFGQKENFFVYLAPIDSMDIPAITGSFQEQEKHPLIALLDAEEDFCSFGNYDIRTEPSDRYNAILKKYYLIPIPAACYGGCESSLTIDSMGNIFDCHRLLGHEDYACGNVFTGRVFNKISAYYADPYITDEACNQCNLLPLCQGGCKYRASKYGKSHACTSIKGAVKELIRRARREMDEL